MHTLLEGVYSPGTPGSEVQRSNDDQETPLEDVDHLSDRAKPETDDDPQPTKARERTAKRLQGARSTRTSKRIAEQLGIDDQLLFGRQQETEFCVPGIQETWEAFFATFLPDVDEAFEQGNSGYKTLYSVFNAVII